MGGFIGTHTNFQKLLYINLYIRDSWSKSWLKKRVRASPRSRPEFLLEKFGIEELDVLETSSTCSITSLLCAIFSLGAKNLSGLLETTELCKGFFQQVVILEQSTKSF